MCTQCTDAGNAIICGFSQKGDMEYLATKAPFPLMAAGTIKERGAGKLQNPPGRVLHFGLSVSLVGTLLITIKEGGLNSHTLHPAGNECNWGEKFSFYFCRTRCIGGSLLRRMFFYYYSVACVSIERMHTHAMAVGLERCRKEGCSCDHYHLGENEEETLLLLRRRRQETCR